MLGVDMEFFQFLKNIKLLNYTGVDCDNLEIDKNKYSNEKHVKLHCAFLANESKKLIYYT